MDLDHIKKSVEINIPTKWFDQVGEDGVCGVGYNSDIAVAAI